MRRTNAGPLMSRFRFFLRDGRRNTSETSASWNGSSSEAPGPADGKRRLIWGEGLVARISNDYRPQLPVVGKDIPGPAVPCHVGTARGLETVNNRTRSVGQHDSTVQQVSLLKDWLTQMANDSCGEGCGQLDDFKWFLPADERAGDLTALESEIEVLDSESEVEYIEPDSIPLQTETTAQQLLCPPVVAQTRPMEGCIPALPRRLRRGHDVLTEDGAVAVDTRQVSAASDTVVSQEIHRKSECVPTVVPTLAAASQTTA